MDIKHRITSFIMLHAGWIVWLVVALATAVGVYAVRNQPVNPPTG